MAQLPTDVREHDNSKTSIYHQGKLVRDGATGQSSEGADGAAAPGPGSGMSELLSWGISNSDPEELKRRADAGERAPLTALDKEMLDVLLGQPTVAAMRALLVKLEDAEKLATPEGEEEALAALEELEFHCEDLDNANDLVKIGGLNTLLACAAAPAAGEEVKEAALGVVAAALQNNPPVQQAVVALGAPAVLLQLIAPSQPLVVQRKALYALSALLRCGGDAAAGVLAAPPTLPALVQAAASEDAKQRRRALFLLVTLLREPESWAAAVSVGALGAGAPAAPLGAALLAAAQSDDVEARESALQLLLLLRGGEELRAALLGAGGEAAVAALLAAAKEWQQQQQQSGGEAEDHPELVAWTEAVLSWLRGEPWRPGFGVSK